MKHNSVRLLVTAFTLGSRNIALLVLCAAILGGVHVRAASSNTPIVLTGADRRPVTSLNGDWASIVDPYFSGLFSFHHEEKNDGWFLNQKAMPTDTKPVEYDFSKAPKLKVPGDWNTQSPSLFYYEGPIWYERDFLPGKGTYARLSPRRRG